MNDGELDSLHANARRLAQSGNERQRASAGALLPAIEGELALRAANAPAVPARGRRSARVAAETAGMPSFAAADSEVETAAVQAARPAGAPLATHKFAVGNMVKLSRTLLGLPMDGLVYEIVRQLPAERSEFQYRIRTKDGRAERIVIESQLAVASANDAAHAVLATGRLRIR